MSDFSLILVLQFKTSKIINDMAKVQIKSEKVTTFGGIFHVRELFSRYKLHSGTDPIVHSGYTKLLQCCSVAVLKTRFTRMSGKAEAKIGYMKVKN